MTSEVFKLKGLFEQVRNDFIREAEEWPEARLAREVEEKVRLEAEEKTRKEVEDKVAAEDVDVEAEAEAKVDVEEATHIAAEESAKAKDIALTQGESSASDLAPLVLKTLEELQKEQ